MPTLIGPLERRRIRAMQADEWATEWMRAARGSGLPCACTHDWISEQPLMMAGERWIPGRRYPEPGCPQHQWIDAAHVGGD